MMITPEQGGLNEARYTDNNTIISGSNFHRILTQQWKKISSWYKVMCGYKCCISATSMHYHLLTWRDLHLKHLKYIIHNTQNRRSGEVPSRILETYKNYVWTHGCHIYNTTAVMEMSTMCPCNAKHHGTPHWKYVLHCCDKCPNIVLPIQETKEDTTKTCLTIIFHVYCNISRCTVNVQHPHR